MSWKNIKDHYRIGHNVHFREGKLCIGSPYVPDLITISPQGDMAWNRALGPSKNDDLARYWQEMEADKETLLRLLNSPDTFKKSIPVYTYDGGEILEKFCEKPKWPNVTHDGLLMYDNSFSTDKAKVVEWAKRNTSAGIELITTRLAELRSDITEREARLAEYRADLAKLEADYPTK